MCPHSMNHHGLKEVHGGSVLIYRWGHCDLSKDTLLGNVAEGTGGHRETPYGAGHTEVQGKELEKTPARGRGCEQDVSSASPFPCL